MEGAAGAQELALLIYRSAADKGVILASDEDTLLLLLELLEHDGWKLREMPDGLWSAEKDERKLTICLALSSPCSYYVCINESELDQGVLEENTDKWTWHRRILPVSSQLLGSRARAISNTRSH